MHLAQLNIARALYPLDSPQLKEFVDNLERVNLIAEQSSGFIWRLKDDSGNATGIQVFDDPQMIVNMSIWKDLESLKYFMYQTFHKAFLMRRREWFENSNERTHVLWWIEEGKVTSIQEAKGKLEYLNVHGDTDRAFTLQSDFAR